MRMAIIANGLTLQKRQTRSWRPRRRRRPRSKRSAAGDLGGPRAQVGVSSPLLRQSVHSCGEGRPWAGCPPRRQRR